MGCFCVISFSCWLMGLMGIVLMLKIGRRVLSINSRIMLSIRLLSIFGILYPRWMRSRRWGCLSLLLAHNACLSLDSSTFIAIVEICKLIEDKLVTLWSNPSSTIRRKRTTPKHTHVSIGLYCPSIPVRQSSLRVWWLLWRAILMECGGWNDIILDDFYIELECTNIY